jgi:hypothetical protein
MRASRTQVNRPLAYKAKKGLTETDLPTGRGMKKHIGEGGEGDREGPRDGEIPRNREE